jgi:two-component system cell cycle response regulator
MGDTPRILVVEDSPTQAMQLGHILELEGYQVVVALNGAAAMAMLDSLQPDLIISDIVMPEMDGYELCQAVKSSETTWHIPIILLTTLSDPRDVIQAIRAGADNFITKPYEPRSLVSRIRHVLVNTNMRRNQRADVGIEVFFSGKRHFLNATPIQVMDLLLSTFESAVQKNEELQAANRQLQEALETIKRLQTNYRLALETNADAVVVVDRESLVRYANTAATTLFPPETRPVVGNRFKVDVTPDTVCELEMADLNRRVVVEMRVTQTDWDGESVLLATFRDVTEQVHAREELRHLSMVDELTGLYNRRGFARLAEQQLAAAARTGNRLFLLYADVDGMKWINDNLGHDQGDAALVTAGRLLQSAYRGADVIARMGGDEFAVLGTVTGEIGRAQHEERLVSRIAALNREDDRKFALSVSLGCTVYDPNQPEGLDSLLKRADADMYAQKRTRYVSKAIGSNRL